MIFRITTFFLTIFFIQSLYGQNTQVGIGQWRTHLSYQSVKNVEAVKNKIYAASTKSIYSIDNAGNYTILSKVNGLSDEGVSRIKYNATLDILVIAYENGNIDLMKGDEIINISDIYRKSITGSKTINDINFSQNYAYLSADFGLAILDIVKYEVKETILNLDPNGASNKIYSSSISENSDSIFLATENGLMVAPLNSSVNLLDYYSWYTYGTSDNLPSKNVRAINSLHNVMYAGVVNDGIYYLKNSKWIRTLSFPNPTANITTTKLKDRLLLTMWNKVYSIEGENNINTIFSQPGETNEAVFDAQGNLWVAVIHQGLLNNINDNFTKSHTPPGPFTDQVFGLYYSGKGLLAFAGGYDDSYGQLENPNGFYLFADNNWSNYNSILGNIPLYIKDITSAVYNPKNDTMYLATHGYGILGWKNYSQPKAGSIIFAPGTELQLQTGVLGPYKLIGKKGNAFIIPVNSEQVYLNDVLLSRGTEYSIDYFRLQITFTSAMSVSKTDKLRIEFAYQDSYKIYNDTTTSNVLINQVPGAPFVRITSLAIDKHDNLWVANYNYQGFSTLHKRSAKGIWSSYNFNAQYGNAITFIIDDYDNKWIRTSYSGTSNNNLIVFNENQPTTIRNITKTAGQGGMPDNIVHSLAKDKKGEIWIGTEKGVAVYYNPSQVFSNPTDVGTPIFDGFPLLIDEVITAIKVDGGNRKWIGTHHGLWLLNEDGTEIILHFTAENSPLISNNIIAVEIDELTGEVFIGTDLGIVSYRGTATEGGDKFSGVKVFPNPVKPDFQGLVGITGLATTSIVKITDIYGNLVFETKAQGGMAVWNMKDYKGRKADTGVYLIFAATEDGTQSFVSKVAIVD